MQASILTAMALSALLSTRLQAEHPTEHPSEHLTAGAKAEHPAKGEHPDAGKTAAAGCSMEDVAGAAEKWAGEEAAKGGLKIKDKASKATLDLAFMKVHRERLSKVGKDRYFVCADFKAADGTVYDVDLFMRGRDKDSLKAEGRPSIHKVNGEPRYDWVEKKGLWKQVVRKKAKGGKP